ncbi:MAG: hypothetical protein D6805_05880 [Planctomycetota bacterium]|nr:MAG: hypothetical protein D6805_05880 [Planctomycetota bacterium]
MYRSLWFVMLCLGVWGSGGWVRGVESKARTVAKKPTVLVISKKKISHLQRVFLKRVIDGDTVILSNDLHLRLIGIDTPERREQYYKEAKSFLQKFLSGQKIYLVYGKDRKDRYGRALGYLFVEYDKTHLLFVNGQMVWQGYARVYPYPPNLRYWKVLTLLQREARLKKRGLWSLKAPKKESYYIGSRYRFHRPSCRNARHIHRRRVYFTSRAAALDSGRSPGRCCHP